MKQSPRTIARAKGLRVYTGNACQECWGRQRYVSNGVCVRCYGNRYRQLTPEHKAKEVARVQAWRERKKASVETPAEPDAYDDLV